MKKILLITLLIASLDSCKKDGSTKTQASVSIIGTWRYTKERIQVLSAANAVISDQTTTSFVTDEYVQYNGRVPGLPVVAVVPCLISPAVLPGILIQNTKRQKPSVNCPMFIQLH